MLRSRLGAWGHRELQGRRLIALYPLQHPSLVARAPIETRATPSRASLLSYVCVSPGAVRRGIFSAQRGFAGFPPVRELRAHRAPTIAVLTRACCGKGRGQ